MRWWLFAAVLAFSSANIHASETVSDEAPSVVDMSVAAQGVTVSAIPSPTPVMEVLKLDDPVARARSAKKVRLAKKKASPAMMMTRTERLQVALLISSGKAGEYLGHTYDHDENSQGNLDELDLHRSFSRPRVVDESNLDQADADELPGHVRLRLLFARLKAVEAHALNQVQDTGEPLPESVMQRLKEARLKAVQAHQQKFG
ncbi:MAG: hypothetical protein H6R13_2684 [Proteobacteria bacterium]|nr:hypothetical protein [Pseudomonadota bacterium]